MGATDLEAPASSPPAGTTGSEPRAHDCLAEDKIFHLLQNERRRLALRYLRGSEGAVEMRAVAEQVAAWEHDTTVDALDSDERQRVYIPLYQNHLPKLDDGGVIDYDQSRGVVERTPVADQLDPYIDSGEANDATAAATVRHPQNRWPRYYLWTALGSAGLVAAATFEVPLVGAISPTAISLLVVVAFSVLAVVHVITSLPTAGRR